MVQIMIRTPRQASYIGSLSMRSKLVVQNGRAFSAFDNDGFQAISLGRFEIDFRLIVTDINDGWHGSLLCVDHTNLAQNDQQRDQRQDDDDNPPEWLTK